MSFLFDQSTFESLAKKYTAFHLGSYEDDELRKTKGEKVCNKVLSSIYYS